jgi:uncharacterized protein YbaP (TraB family)
MVRLREWLGRATGALVGALALVPAGGCATAAPVAAPAAAEVMPAAAPGPALWRLSDADTTVYLFGTVHALPEGAEWYDARIQRAFAEADELVTEINMDDQRESATTLASAATLSGGRNLRELMTRENRAQYESALTALGVPVETLDPVEPWFAALNVSMLPLMRSGFNPSAGVDMVLTEAGKDKRRVALETVDEQVALFDTLPLASQFALLEGAVEGAPTAAETLGAMVDRWIEGDADGLATLMNADMDDPVLFQRLLYDRNARWVDWIATRMEQPGTVFIAVGAGHLAGEGSVQDLLGERGLEVTRIWE